MTILNGLRGCLTLLALALPLSAQTVKIAAVGDISCAPEDVNYNNGLGQNGFCQMKATSDLVVGGGFDAVLVLGDNQYEDGALTRFQTSYDPTWGRVKNITHPVVGNHEYITPNAAGYYTYFGAAAGDPTKGYYSFDLGAWHIIVLNSNCAEVGGCDLHSPQYQWLVQDLAAHPNDCTLAAWHHPRFSSGAHGDDPITAEFWSALFNARADVILVGHDHEYERFAPMNPSATPDWIGGLRQFVVGTGGKNLRPFTNLTRGLVERQNSTTHGVLELTLHPDSYEWKFLSASSPTFTDTGFDHCRKVSNPFYTVPPCRVVDTRNAAGPRGGPALQPNQFRDFPIAGFCGVPREASAIAVNVTVVTPSQSGNLRIVPAGHVLPSSSAISFRAGRTRANNGVYALGRDGQLTVQNDMAGGSTHFLIDVTGYFR